MVVVTAARRHEQPYCSRGLCRRRPRLLPFRLGPCRVASRKSHTDCFLHFQFTGRTVLNADPEHGKAHGSMPYGVPVRNLNPAALAWACRRLKLSQSSRMRSTCGLSGTAAPAASSLMIAGGAGVVHIQMTSSSEFSKSITTSESGGPFPAVLPTRTRLP